MNKMLRFNKKGDLFSMEKLLEKFNLNSKKGIENLVIFLVLVIIVIVVINATFTEKERGLRLETLKTSKEKTRNKAGFPFGFRKNAYLCPGPKK